MISDKLRKINVTLLVPCPPSHSVDNGPSPLSLHHKSGTRDIGIPRVTTHPGLPGTAMVYIVITA